MFFYLKNEFMRKFSAVAAAIFMTMTSYSQDSGWISLFDGKTTNGWHKYGGGPAGSAWKVADGALYLDTTNKGTWQIKNGGDIVTDDEFENFDLKLRSEERRVGKGCRSRE